MALQDKFDYLNDTKSLIKQSIINKGVDVTEQDTFRSYAGKIDQIQQGGTTPEPTGDYRVRFYDFDGTYKDVWVNSGESVTPPNFNHSVATNFAPALTLQEWNRPYTNITKNEEIGAVYIPTDGKTHFYLQITGGTGKNITLYLANYEGGNIVINWGDGTTAFNSTSTSITVTHTFADYGIYHGTIENTLTGDFLLGQGSSATPFCGGDVQQMRDALMAIYLGEKVQTSIYSFYGKNALKYMTIPNSVTSIASRAFQACYSIADITLSNNVTSIEANTFYNCYSLTNFKTPNNVTSIGNYAFYNCYSIANIIIPNSVTSLGFYTFQNCYSLKKVLLEGDTVKTLRDSTVFIGVPKSTIFFVKDELVATYKSATNWVTYADRILPMSEEGNYYG